VEVIRELISVGRQMGFSRARIVDAEDPERVIAISTGSGFDLGVVPEGFEPVNNPVHRFDDAADLPPLREVFGGRSDDASTLVIDQLTPELGAPIERFTRVRSTSS
jgi:hypothetical protein